jgi:hypothetical protein
MSVKAPAAMLLGLAGWLPLGFSLLAALADASDAAMALPLIVAGVLGAVGLVLTVTVVMRQPVSSLDAVTSGLSLALNLALVVAATLWALSVHWQ